MIAHVLSNTMHIHPSQGCVYHVTFVIVHEQYLLITFSMSATCDNNNIIKHALAKVPHQMGSDTSSRTSDHF